MKIWTLYLVLPGRYGPLLSGISTFVLLVLIQLWLVGEIFWVSTGLFFAAKLAYLPAVHAYILSITHAAVAELAPNLSVSTEQQSATLERMERPGWRLQVICLVAGSSAAIAHIQYMGFIPLNPDGTLNFSTTMVKVSIAGTLLTWITMTTVISGLIQNNYLLSDLSIHLKQVDLFRKQPWQPLARVATASSLALIGSNALFPLLFIESDSPPAMKILPGMMLTLPTVIAMVLVPLRSARHLIAEQKNQRLNAIDEAISKLTNPQSITDMGTLNTLLTQRGHLQKVSSWPLNLGNLGRLLFYLIIPPLTWVGAALIERLVDGVL